LILKRKGKGYGYTKSFSVTPGIQRKLLFPTAVSSYAPDISFGIEIRSKRVNGKRYAVGEEVIINRLPYEATTREDFIGSPSYMAILEYVVSHKGFHRRDKGLNSAVTSSEVMLML